MSIPMNTPSMVVMANPWREPKPMYHRGIMATTTVAAEETMILNAVDSFCSTFLVVGALPVVITSSVMMISWSMPVPMTAMMPATLGRSISQWMNAATPSRITTSNMEVRNMGSMILGSRYLKYMMAPMAIWARIMAMMTSFSNAAPCSAGTWPELTACTVTGSAPALI